MATEVEVPSNPALEDLKEIVATHVELTDDEQKTVEKLLPNLLATLKPEVRKELEAEYAEKYTEFQKTLTESNQALIKEEMEKYRAALEPLSKDEIADLLNQEYTDFTFVVKVDGTDGQTVERKFTIRELPQAVESRFVKHLQEKLIPTLQSLVAAEWSLDGTLVDKIKGALDALPGVLDVAAQCVTIVLDPFSKENLNQDWVVRHLSTYRMSMVILAQVEANKYRDFFSNGFRLSKTVRRT